MLGGIPHGTLLRGYKLRKVGGGGGGGRDQEGSVRERERKRESKRDKEIKKVRK